MESIIQFEIPTNIDFDALALATNYTNLFNGLQQKINDANEKGSSGAMGGNLLDNYGVIAIGIWMIIIFAFMTATIVFCICSCLFYNKIRKWKLSEQQRRRCENVEANLQEVYVDDNLPNYTLVSGLPSYDAALEQYTKSKSSKNPGTLSTPTTTERPSIFQIFHYDDEIKRNEKCGQSLLATNSTDLSLKTADELENNKNQKLYNFLNRLQSQISTVESTTASLDDDSENDKPHEKSNL